MFVLQRYLNNVNYLNLIQCSWCRVKLNEVRQVYNSWITIGYIICCPKHFFSEESDELDAIILGIKTTAWSGIYTELLVHGHKLQRPFARNVELICLYRLGSE